MSRTVMESSGTGRQRPALARHADTWKEAAGTIGSATA
jgi:hypothetical protein